MDRTSREVKRETYDQLARPYDCIVRYSIEPGSCIVSFGKSALRGAVNGRRLECTDGAIISIKLGDAASATNVCALPKATNQH